MKQIRNNYLIQSGCFKVLIPIILVTIFSLTLIAQPTNRGAKIPHHMTRHELEEYESLNIRIKYGDSIYILKRRKIVTEKNHLLVNYACSEVPDLKIYISTGVKNLSGRKILTHEIGISSGKKITEDLTFFFPILSIRNNNKVWYPLKNGTGKTIENLAQKNSASFRCAGRSEKMENDLAIPLVVYNSKNYKVAVMTDPYFSSMFDNNTIYWTYPKEVGLEDKTEKRSIVEAFEITGPDNAINVFYKTILKEIPAGPSWIKNIAMISYDYMSDNGKGWFNDIDSLVKVVPDVDRGKILLTLHGWFDYVGRYCFDVKTGKLDNEWHTQLKKDKETLGDLHRRIKYAKDRGFKVAMYFADGIISSDKLDDYSPDKAIAGSGWNGPDVLGKSYRRNIAVPAYYNFYLDYATALFDEFGKQADMFVWDETYYIKAGHLGTEKYRSYLDRKFMRLVKEITAKLHTINPDAAFVTSDLIGPDNTGYGGAGNDTYSDVPPYALVADGTYQDSNCLPMFWSYGIFPNYRNVLWSCNWTSVSRFDYTLFGVLQYQATVVFTNGWGDNIGFSEMNQKDKTNLMKLFNYRKSFKTNLKWFESLPPFINTCTISNKEGD